MSVNDRREEAAIGATTKTAPLLRSLSLSLSPPLPRPIAIAGVWLAAVLALTLLPDTARAANSLVFTPASSVTDVPGQVVLDLEMDFSDATSGGGVVIAYDPAVVTLSTVVFDGTFPDDADFRCPGSTVVSCPADPDFISVGSFGGISGQHRIVSLVFDAAAPGQTTVGASIVNDFDNGSGIPLAVDVQVGSIQVPEPGETLLLLSGLLGLKGLARRRRHPAP
jgi:hypothetical protein